MTREAGSRELAGTRTPPRHLPLLRAAFAAGLVLLVLAFAAGTWRSLSQDGHVPGIHRDYLPSINALLRADHPAAALEQMRLAALIDPGDRTVRASVLPNMARLAERLGDRDVELLALRRLVREEPRNPEWHLRLAASILDAPSISLDEAKEAARHAQAAEKLDPWSARALLLESVIASTVGQPATARELLARALVIDPGIQAPAAVPRLTGAAPPVVQGP